MHSLTLLVEKLLCRYIANKTREYLFPITHISIPNYFELLKLVQ